MNRNYILNKNVNITYKGEMILTSKNVANAMNFANNALSELSDTTLKFNINIFEALGMRNLSGLIGEYFVKSVMKVSNGKLEKNLHQDGYPDLLLVDTPERKHYFNSLYTTKNGKRYPKDKEYFSPYKYGGLEVKATCGSTPPASKHKKLLIGEQRISLIQSFDWKAHHRSTNHLLGILWDFIEEKPIIVACFFHDDLTIDDWGKIVQPKDDGGRTTSVSIMNRCGVKKMCEKWVAVIDDFAYINKLAEKKWIGYKVKD